MHILVFKTNISETSDSQHIGTILTDYKDSLQWNFDHWDADHILRIESDTDCSADIIQLITQAGYFCQALED